MATSSTLSQRRFIVFREHYVTEAGELSESPVHGVSCVICPVCFVSAGVGGQKAYCAPPAQPWRSSAFTLDNQGHSAQWFDHQLCLFSPAALRDRCKCSSSLDALTEISTGALHLFITPCLASLLPHLLPLPSLPLQDWLHYLCLLFFFFIPAPAFF